MRNGVPASSHLRRIVQIFVGTQRASAARGRASSEARKAVIVIECVHMRRCDGNIFPPVSGPETVRLTAYKGCMVRVPICLFTPCLSIPFACLFTPL